MSDLNRQDMDIIFDTKRTELLSLLNKSDTIIGKLDESGYFPSDTDDLRNQVNITRQRCHEGLFSIALIAGFQSGKSTTLNAFSDGREIAPRGLGGGGIKTSACLIKVQNPNQGEEETAKISWRSHKDLLNRLDEILGITACQIPNSETAKKLRLISKQKSEFITEKEKERYTQEYFSIIDFSTNQGKTLLEEALKEELKIYNESQQKGSEQEQDKLDLLRFAMIVLAYHNDPTLEDLKKQTYFQPKQIESYLKFPDKFSDRWNKCFNNFREYSVKQEFSISEVMYAFIEEVSYVIHSDNLKKSGAQIIDCPGLFVSKYDTSTALDAMEKSSAIWYLLGGDKELSQSEMKTLSIINNAGHAKKVFFGINYKDDPMTPAKQAVISTILGQLNELGFTGSYQTEPLYFNAFLALRAMQGEKLITDSLEPYSQQQIKLDAKAMLNDNFESVEQAWLESVQQVLIQILGIRRSKEVLSLELTKSAVEFIKSESKWDLATEKIKQYVFDTKAWSVLVDLGCEPVINTLTKTEASLQIAEDNAKRSLEQAEEEWNTAQEKLDLFKKESGEIVVDYIDDNWEIVLAQSFWKEVFVPAIEATGKSAAPIIANEATVKNALLDPFTGIGNGLVDGLNTITGAINIIKDPLLNIAKNYVNKEIGININIDIGDIDKMSKSETLKERCGAIIKNEFENNVNIKSQGWFNSLKKGGNKDYDDKILQRVVKACELLSKRWKSLDLNHNSYLQGLDVNIPKLSGDIRSDMEKFNQVGFDGAVDKSIEKPFQDLAVVGGSFYFLFFFDLIFPGVGVLLFSLAILTVVVASRFKPQDKYIKDIADKITEELNKGVKVKEGDITDKLQVKLKVIRDFYEKSITDSFEKMNQQLDERIKEAKDSFSNSQAERDKVSKIAKDFRQSDIEPLREEIQHFQSSVEAIWKKPS